MNNEQNDTETKQKLAKATEQLTKANETIGTMIDQIGMLQLKDKATTDQRDRLAAAMQEIKQREPVNRNGDLFYSRYTEDGDWARYEPVDPFGLLAFIYPRISEALQSLDQPEQNNMKPEQNNMNTPTPTPRTDELANRLIPIAENITATTAQTIITQVVTDILTLTTELERELTAAREELETERIRLAACGVVAMADTKESRTKAREMLPEYRSASLSDVERRVDECIELREQRDRLVEALENCREDLIELLW